MNLTATDMAPILLAEMWQTMLMVGGLLVIILMVLWNTQKRARAAEKGKTPRSTVREMLHPTQSKEGLKDDMQRLLAELLETTRDIEGQLETKFRKLDVLIAEADERIAELKRLQGDDATDPPGAKAPKRTASRKPASTIGPKKPAAPTDDAERPVEHEGVYRLADDGKDPTQIAVELGKTIGEIELILALRKK